MNRHGKFKLKEIAEALRTNTSWTTLNFESNEMDSKGAIAIANALLTNTTGDQR